MIDNVRTVMIDINGDGKKTSVPLTTKNKKILEANNIVIPNIEQDTMTGDGTGMEQVASQTETKKITPQDVGVNESSNFFTKKADILAILPNDMSGQEIMDRYNLDMLPGQTFNKFTIYKPNK